VQRLAKALMLVAALSFMPTIASAFVVADDDSSDDFGDNVHPSVPEPSGALVLGVALTTVAIATRRKSK
jgi:hypothetical protein